MGNTNQPQSARPPFPRGLSQEPRREDRSPRCHAGKALTQRPGHRHATPSRPRFLSPLAFMEGGRPRKVTDLDWRPCPWLLSTAEAAVNCVMGGCCLRGFPTSGGRQGRETGPLEIFQAFSQDRPPAACSPHPAGPAQVPGTPSSPPSMSPGRRCPHRPATRPRATTQTARSDRLKQEPRQFCAACSRSASTPAPRQGPSLCFPPDPRPGSGSRPLGPVDKRREARVHLPPGPRSLV